MEGHSRDAAVAGTVTLLFSDIEGSTGLLRRLGPGYEALLTEHRSLLRIAFAGAGGEEVETRGDSFLVAFGSARAAVDCRLAFVVFTSAAVDTVSACVAGASAVAGSANSHA